MCAAHGQIRQRVGEAFWEGINGVQSAVLRMFPPPDTASGASDAGGLGTVSTEPNAASGGGDAPVAPFQSSAVTQLVDDSNCVTCDLYVYERNAAAHLASAAPALVPRDTDGEGGALPGTVGGGSDPAVSSLPRTWLLLLLDQLVQQGRGMSTKEADVLLAPIDAELGTDSISVMLPGTQALATVTPTVVPVTPAVTVVTPDSTQTHERVAQFVRAICASVVSSAGACNNTHVGARVGLLFRTIAVTATSAPTSRQVWDERPDVTSAATSTRENLLTWLLGVVESNRVPLDVALQAITCHVSILGVIARSSSAEPASTMAAKHLVCLATSCRNASLAKFSAFLQCCK